MNDQMKDFFDIFGVWHAPWWQHPVFLYALYALCLLFIIFLIWRFVSTILKRKKKLSAWEIALKELAILENSDIMNEQFGRNFYSRLTIIIKQYLVGRFGFDVYGCTDREVLVLLDEQVLFPRELVPLIQEIFDHASHIKFANAASVVEQMRQDIALSTRLVKETIPLQS